MSSEEVDFLRDEVQRLNDILSRYQEKYPSLPPQSGRSRGGSADIPWRTDRKLMAPLLAEYDANLDLLTSSVDQETVKALREQMHRVVAENDRLRRELKECIQNQLESVPTELLAPTVGGDADAALENLNQQLINSKQEKDTMEEMWRIATLEVERLEAALQNAHAQPGLQQIESQAAQIKSQYLATVGELSAEISSLNDELRHTKSEYSAAQLQIKDLRATLEEVRMQLMKQEQDKVMVTGGKERSDNHVGDLSRKMAGAQSMLDNMAHELEQCKQEKSRVEQQVVELQKKLSAAEQKEYEAMLQVRDSVQMVEAAMLEKDQALQREKQTSDSMGKLEASMSKLMDEAGVRTRQEVDNVKAQANLNLNRLMEDIHTLEMENTEKQAQIDRAVRDKRAAESELEKIYQEGMIAGGKEAGTMDELNRRACNAERTRDEALLKLDTTESTLRRMETTYKQDKAHLQAELDQLKERLELMNNEFSAASDDRVRLVEQMDEMKKKMTSLKQERDQAVRTRTKEVTCLENEFRLREQDLEAKVQTLEDSHRHAMMDIRQMLNSQQRMSAKWKEECQTVTHKFESKVTELRSELTREKKRTQELTKLLRESQTKTADVEQMLAEYTHNIKRMEERVREAENRAATSHMQIGRQIRKDRNIVEERRLMQRQLERSLAESKIGESGVNDGGGGGSNSDMIQRQ